MKKLIPFILIGLIACKKEKPTEPTNNNNQQTQIETHNVTIKAISLDSAFTTKVNGFYFNIGILDTVAYSQTLNNGDSIIAKAFACIDTIYYNGGLNMELDMARCKLQLYIDNNYIEEIQQDVNVYYKWTSSTADFNIYIRRKI